jgi:hypothetical protein
MFERHSGEQIAGQVLRKRLGTHKRSDSTKAGGAVGLYVE